MIQQQTHTITFRGKPAEIVFEDHGHETHCNTHVIEWWFADETMNGDIVVTDEEEQSVFEVLRALERRTEHAQETRPDQGTAL